MQEKQYIAIDLKSFYASVECVDRGLDPLSTNLVVADPSRTDKTICLAVSPSLKSFGIPGRPRLFEVNQKIREVNRSRKQKCGGNFTGSSNMIGDLMTDESLEVGFIIAPPRMARYMEVSSGIYSIYLKYVSSEDIHVYSVDEVFMDVTSYLGTYKESAKELAERIIGDVLSSTGITATVGIGTNLYLAKVAMDIVAKHIPPDSNGARIAELDEEGYRKELWSHRPITDFWRVGHGYASKLEKIGLMTMGDIARCSIGKSTDFYNEEILYRMFGINAELLIDHAWGWEPCTISDIKKYKPENNSISTGQVLQEPYSFDKARIIVLEMTDSLVLDLVEKRLMTDQIVLTVGYDIIDSNGYENRETVFDRYGRKVPKSAHSSINLGKYTSSTKLISKLVLELYDRIVDRNLHVRRMYVVANHVIDETKAETENSVVQLDLFSDSSESETENAKETESLNKEKQVQKALLDIKKKFGKNSIIKAMNLQDGATAIDRNSQIGGHKA